MEGIVFKQLKEEHLPEASDIYNYFFEHTTVSFDMDLQTEEQIGRTNYPAVRDIRPLS